METYLLLSYLSAFAIGADTGKLECSVPRLGFYMQPGESVLLGAQYFCSASFRLH